MDKPTREQVLAFECPTCGAWKGSKCKQSNRALGHQPTTATSKPTSRLHKARVTIAVTSIKAQRTKGHLTLVVSN